MEGVKESIIDDPSHHPKAISSAKRGWTIQTMQSTLPASSSFRGNPAAELKRITWNDIALHADSLKGNPFSI
jgi:hypothetical protein